MTNYRGAWVALLLAGAVALAACGGSSTPKSATVATPSASARMAAGAGDAAPFAAVVAASELTVGQNRFSLGIIEQPQNEPLADATVHFRFFTLQGNQGTLKFESDGRFIAPGRDAGVTAETIHRHPDGSTHIHLNSEANVGVYIASVTFDTAGKWGVETTFKAPGGKSGTVSAPFDVLATSSTPAVGQPAPRTRNLTARDVTDLSQIDSSDSPISALHQTTVADAIAAGQPALVAFLTPGYCQTRFCGPSYELLTKLLPEYGDKAAIIHIEIYKDPATRTVADAVTEWHLVSEPYFFVIDKAGIIRAKFEGPTSLDELRQALAQVTS